jgi:serine/threonine protein kinase
MHEKEIAYIVTQLLSLVDYLNEMHLILRAINPENIMVTEQTLGDYTYYLVRIIDFNDTVRFVPGETLGIEGWCFEDEDAMFVPPEAHTTQKYGPAADLWAIGVVAHILLTGANPFPNVPAMLENDFVWNPEHVASPHAKAFVKNLLSRDPETRALPKAAATNPWFKVLDMNKESMLSERIVNTLMTRSETKFM